MTIEHTPDGTPYLSDQSYLSETPPYTQELAQIIDAGTGGGVCDIKDSKFNDLQPADPMKPYPVGMVTAFMGETAAPDYWLLCDGRSYDATYFVDLAEINDPYVGFHGDGVFRVPDLRGRSPIGPAPYFAADGSEPAAPLWSGDRKGDWRVHNHAHSMGVSETSGREAGISSAGNALWNVYWTDWSKDNFNYMAGTGHNYHPVTGINFIVYTGKPTLDESGNILPECGQGEPIDRVTTRMMIEARLAAKGIDEEEIKMLKEQLEEIKKTEAK